MTLTAELPLVCSALALALVATLRALPWRERPAVLGLTLAIGAVGGLAPLLAYPFVPQTNLDLHALWEWSAVGGPTIQASYRLDGIGAIGAALGTAYAVASLFAATRSERSPLLPALVLANGLATIALAVTDDLIASTVLLGVLAALTAAAALLVTPPRAAARIAAYLAFGLQAFVLAALLISRFGGASFRFGDIRPTAISPGIVLAASIGAALFAGLYPFVPWRYQRARGRATERETLRGLLAMPAGIGASLVLLRLLGVTRTDISTLGLPGVDGSVRMLAAVAILVAVAIVAVRRRVIPGRSIAVGALLLAGALAYPQIRWSHVVLAAALLTIAYAAAVSLAHPEEWEVARYDVALATLWIALALGTPVSLAAALVLLAGDAAVAVAESVWLPPHREHLVLVSGSTILVAGLVALAAGALDAGETPSVALAVVAVAAVLALQLAHLARRAQTAAMPVALEATAAATAFLAATFLAVIVAPAVHTGIAVTIGRTFPPAAASAPLAVPVLIAFAVLVGAAVRSARPLVPDHGPFVDVPRLVVRLADPVPAGEAAFAAVDWTATRLAAVLGFFERRAGVGLAAVLILALLVWSVR